MDIKPTTQIKKHHILMKEPFMSVSDYFSGMTLAKGYCNIRSKSLTHEDLPLSLSKSDKVSKCWNENSEIFSFILSFMYIYLQFIPLQHSVLTMN